MRILQCSHELQIHTHAITLLETNSDSMQLSRQNESPRAERFHQLSTAPDIRKLNKQHKEISPCTKKKPNKKLR